MGIDTDGILKSSEQLADEQEQAMSNQVAIEGDMAMARGAGEETGKRLGKGE
jgi:hypothetical protein